MGEVRYQWAEGDGPGFDAACAVRIRVFVEEQGYDPTTDVDGYDKKARHLVGFLGGEPVCTARVFRADDGRWMIGRVAVDLRLRGTGEGLRMMERCTAWAAEQGAQTVFVSAQEDKAGFYHRAGFFLTGITSFDEGNPHVEMVKVVRR